MLLTITTTHTPATDLGYLLHKHPDRVQQFGQSFGSVTVLYPEATAERCTAAVLLDIDPVRLARSRGKGSPDFSLAQHVNDRPYAASSLLGVALADVFSTARSGRCDSRQALADGPLPLEVGVPVLPCRGGADIARRVFEPLGWAVTATPIALDEGHPEWGDSRYLSLRLRGEVRLADALNQLYVLLPVLDESKHYWQAPDEVDKLLRSGGSWLAGHPDAALITRRYLGRSRGLAATALARLAELDDTPDAPPVEPVAPPVESVETPGFDKLNQRLVERVETPMPRTPLNTLRHEAVLGVLTELGATSVIDLGCGPGALLQRLLRDARFTRVAGCDVSTRALQQAARRLRLEEMGERQAARLELFQAALTYEDPRFAGYDAAVLMEVIEHVDPPRLAALEHVVLGVARPGAVVVTTPNAEYNALYEGLVGMRHTDHRFEWTRAELRDWAEAAAARHGYAVELRGVGEPDERHGCPTQLATFTRECA